MKNINDIIIRRLIDRRQINKAVRENPELRIKTDDGIYEQKIINIAEYAASEENNIKIIMLAGPSGSGKTTTANMLKRRFGLMGISSDIISLDHFYLKPEKFPKNPDGTPDFESVYALDLELMHKCFIELISSGESTIPYFSFSGGGRIGSRDIKIAKNGVVVVEGIHALNPLIIETLPADSLLKIYVSVESGIFEDDELIFSPRDLRLVRRMIRDSIFRNATVERTLEMWDGVIRGEKEYLYIHKDTADVDINSMHSYEPCLFKNRALKLLEDVDESSPFYGKVSELIKAIKPFEALDEDLVPPPSLLREFIGGGIYDY